MCRLDRLYRSLLRSQPEHGSARQWACHQLLSTAPACGHRADGDGVADRRGSCSAGIPPPNASSSPHPPGRDVAVANADGSLLDQHQNWSLSVPTDCGPPKGDAAAAAAGSVHAGRIDHRGEHRRWARTSSSSGRRSRCTAKANRLGRTAEQGCFVAGQQGSTEWRRVSGRNSSRGQKLTQTVPTSPAQDVRLGWQGCLWTFAERPYSVTTRRYTYDIVASAAITVPVPGLVSPLPPANSWRHKSRCIETTQVTRQDQRGFGLGGWSLNMLHAYVRAAMC
jgi:hypothetical protein